MNEQSYCIYMSPKQLKWVFVTRNENLDTVQLPGPEFAQPIWLVAIGDFDDNVDDDNV